MISVEHLKVRAGGRSIFQDLNLTINDGEVIGVIGPSGCGKSLLLRTMIQLHSAEDGTILFDGEKLLRSPNGALLNNGKIGMVFQNYNLFDHLTVLENVVSGPIHLTKEKPEDVLKRAIKIIRTVGLGDVAYQYPTTLSGGQKQRVAIARTLAMDPDIILLDEPTSSLDPMMKGEVESVIRLIAAQGKTMIIVSHEMELIRNLCNRVIFLNEGIVFEEGTPDEIFEHPKKAATRRFVRQLRVLEFDVESKNFDFIGNNTRVQQFAFANAIPPQLQQRLVAILEELYQMVIIQPIEDNRMHIAFEFNRKENTIRGDVKFTGPYIDPDDPMFFFSWPIIVKRATDVEVKRCPDNDPDEFTNDVHIIIKDEK